jgi:hypothetical protein
MEKRDKNTENRISKPFNSIQLTFAKNRCAPTLESPSLKTSKASNFRAEFPMAYLRCALKWPQDVCTYFCMWVVSLVSPFFVLLGFDINQGNGNVLAAWVSM